MMLINWDCPCALSLTRLARSKENLSSMTSGSLQVAHKNIRTVLAQFLPRAWLSGHGSGGLSFRIVFWGLSFRIVFCIPLVLF